MSSHNGTADAGNGLTEFWATNGEAIETLGMYAGGIMFYALVVNFFYQIISKRVMFAGQDEGGRRVVGGPGHGFLYLMLFPLFSFAFFVLLALALIFLGGENQRPDLTITLAMAVVLAVRISAYFSEATSHDVAKMLPLGLLGVMLVNAQVVEVVESFQRLQAIQDHLDLVLLYFAVVVVAEYVLRSIYLFLQLFKKKGPKRPVKPSPAVEHGEGPGR